MVRTSLHPVKVHSASPSSSRSSSSSRTAVEQCIIPDGVPHRCDQNPDKCVYVSTSKDGTTKVFNHGAARHYDADEPTSADHNLEVKDPKRPRQSKK